MFTTQIDLGSTYYLELFITDSYGSPISGLSVTYSIYNSIDDSLIDSGSLIDLGNGTYKIARVFNTVGQFRVIYTTPTNYTDEIETIIVKESAASELSLKRILGLVQENFRTFNHIYDKNNNLIGCDIKIYGSKLDTENNMNPIAVYRMDCIYNLHNNHLIDYQSRRIS